MEILKDRPISKKTDEVSLLSTMQYLAREILMDRNILLDSNISNELKHSTIEGQIKNKNKLKSIMKELLIEMEKDNGKN